MNSGGPYHNNGNSQTQKKYRKPQVCRLTPTDKYIREADCKNDAAKNRERKHIGKPTAAASDAYEDLLMHEKLNRNLRRCLYNSTSIAPKSSSMVHGTIER